MSVQQPLNPTSARIVCTCDLDGRKHLHLSTDRYDILMIIITKKNCKYVHSFLLTSEDLCLSYQSPKPELWALETELTSAFRKQWSAEQSKMQGSESRSLEQPSPALESLGEVFEMVLRPYRRVSNLMGITWF